MVETRSPQTHSDLIDSFARRYPFPLDEFQRQAIDALDRGHSALVAAPTGTGKTLVAEFGIYRALSLGRRVYYTTPIKALSNQKYRDFRNQYGDAVGLLTGDTVVQPSATALVDPVSGDVTLGTAGGGQVVVMTTEVLRNMLIQAGEPLDDVACVVFDEIHYMADPARGTTWEEAIICCPRHVQLVCLSATVANSAEIADWVGDTHGETALVEHAERSVPLEHYYFLDNALRLAVDAAGRRVERFPNVGGEARHGIRYRSHDGKRGLDAPDGPRQSARREPAPPDTVGALQRHDLLPALYFVFSRRETEAAAALCARLRLADSTRRQEISSIVAERLARLAPEDRALGQVRTLERLLVTGVGFHHAGLLPVLKVLVEELFAAGLLGAVFATDTLSLGINMPARTVVVGEFTKFDGESRRLLTANEYRQLTGRAGRRGIDPLGTAVVPYSPWIAAEEVFEVATGPLLPVESAFGIRYNTVLNLWSATRDGDPRERLVGLMAASLHEYQLDGRLRELRSRAARLSERVSGDPFECDRCTPEGLTEYELLRRSLPRVRKDVERAVRAETDLLAAAEAPADQPPRSETRRALRTYVGGEPVHVVNRGWGLFLNRPEPIGSAVALVLLGPAARLLSSYAAIDRLDPAGQSVPLPAELVTLVGQTDDVRPRLAPEQWQALETECAKLELPDVAAEANRARAARLEAAGPVLRRAAERVAATRAALRDLEAQIEQHPSHACPRRAEHREALASVAAAREEIEEIRSTIVRLGEARRRRTRGTLRSIERVLDGFGYLRRSVVTAKGEMLRDVFDQNGLIVCEAIEARVFDSCSPAELAEALSWFAYDRDQSFPNRHRLPRHLLDLRDRLWEVEAAVQRAEDQAGLRISAGFSRLFAGFALAWCQGASFDEVVSGAGLAEGDVMLTFNKTLDLMRQIRAMLRRSAPTHVLLRRLVTAEQLMRRGIVEECCRVVEPAGEVLPA